MEDILLHVFFVSPLIRFILRPDNSLNKRNPTMGLFLAILVLAIVGFFQFQREDQNYYETLGLHFGCSRSQIASNYHKLTLKYHPDKNSEESAKEIFEKILNAHDILSNDLKRRQYNRFGDLSKKGEIGEDQFWDVFFVMLLHVLVPLFFGLLYSLDDHSQSARNIFLGVMGLSMSSEIILRFSNSSDTYLNWIPYFCKLAPFEKIKVLQGLIPLALNGARLLTPRASHTQNISSTCEDIKKHLFNSNITLINRLDMTIDLLKMMTNNKEKLDEIVAIKEKEAEEEDLKNWNEIANCFPDNMNKPDGLDLSDLLTKSDCKDGEALNLQIQLYNNATCNTQHGGYFKGLTFASFIFTSFLLYKFFWVLRSFISV